MGWCFVLTPYFSAPRLRYAFIITRRGIMAKSCTVCHQTYPDHLKACPHCEKRRAEDSSVIRLHDPNASDSWEPDPSSSTHERRGDVITMPGSSPEDSAIEILPDKGSP